MLCSFTPQLCFVGLCMSCKLSFYYILITKFEEFLLCEFSFSILTQTSNTRIWLFLNMSFKLFKYRNGLRFFNKKNNNFRLKSSMEVSRYLFLLLEVLEIDPYISACPIIEFSKLSIYFSSKMSHDIAFQPDSVWKFNWRVELFC